MTTFYTYPELTPVSPVYPGIGGENLAFESLFGKLVVPTVLASEVLNHCDELGCLVVHAAANAQSAVDSIIGTTFEDEAETTEETGDAAAGASEESYASAAY